MLQGDFSLPPHAAGLAGAAAAEPVPDRYGFYTGAPSTPLPDSSAAAGGGGGKRRHDALRIIRRREKKWLAMFNNWDRVVAKEFPRLRERCRKGIPDSVRARAWYYLCGACFMQRDQPDLYQRCLAKQPNEKVLDEIDKDLSRQFPHHELFVQDQGHGQQALRRLLQAYSGCHPEVGYCQAMAPLAGALLLHMPELDAFYTMVSLFDTYMRDYFRPGLEAVQVDGQILYGLLKRMYPDVYRHLVKYKVEPLHFMVDWFMCLYVRNLPWPTLLRQRRHLKSFEDTLDCLRNLPASVTEASSLLPTALLLELSAKDFEQEHTKQLKKFNQRKQGRHQMQEAAAA
uniref:Rab-GAP TBC domain-containing protein n=1 Tax=Macrostomum lignano TaxID=282301 RepID=A0A1I8HRK6_9PLAT